MQIRRYFLLCFLHLRGHPSLREAREASVADLRIDVQRLGAAEAEVGFIGALDSTGSAHGESAVVLVDLDSHAKVAEEIELRLLLEDRIRVAAFLGLQLALSCLDAEASRECRNPCSFFPQLLEAVAASVP